MARTLFSCGGSNFIASAKEVAVVLADSPSLTSEFECLPPGPITFLTIPASAQLNSEWLKATTTQMLASDDVFNKDFISRVLVVSTSGRSAEIERSRLQLCKELGISLFSVTTSVPLKAGPYFAIGSKLHKVSKLYSDPQGAFMFGVQVDEFASESFTEFYPGTIPVPSRLYFDPPSANQPLSGKRIALKDVFHLKGTHTTVSSRDFRAFNGIDEATAPMVLKLIAAGGVIVGKTMTVQFASGERASDWVDYQCPFNPRGDGYLDPNCSSAGSAAGLAAYSWLDYSIGTDSLGSMTGPAADNGIFGNRPTHGISDLHGVLLVSSLLDTAGCFSRSITDLRTIGRVWYGEAEMASQEAFPSRILYVPEEFNKFPKVQRELMEAFIKDVEHGVGSSRISLDICSAWEADAPKTAARPIQKFLATTLAHLQLYGSYHNNKGFRASFQEKHGREPYANPMIRYKWDLGERLSPKDYQVACDQRTIYRNFMLEHVFSKGTVLILPAGSPEALRRDVYHGSPEERENKLQGFGFQRDLYSYLGGLPQLVIPIGQIQVTSPVTKGIVYEPVSISLVGPPGLDCALMEFAEHVLWKSGRALKVQAGSTAFAVDTKKVL